MLEKFRQHSKGLLSWGIVLLIALTFTLWGVSNFFTEGSNSVAAKVNGEKISWHTIDTLYERLRLQFGNTPINEDLLKQQLRVALIQRTALLMDARALGLSIGETQIFSALKQNPAFQVDGEFSKERYLEALNKGAENDVAYRNQLAQDMLLAQFEQAVAQSSFSLTPEINRVISLMEQRRNFSYVLLPIQRFRNGVKVSVEDLKAFYEANTALYVIPEQVAVEYLELSLDQLAKRQAVEEDELKKHYEQHITSYSAPERVQARHILIAVPQTASPAEAEKAHVQANELLGKIKSGSDFAKLAKEFSSDKGSAAQGGELGWFAKGQMVPEFEKAAFELKTPKEVAGPVRTQFGYHIIQLLEHKKAETRPFKEVRELVLEQLQREKAQIVFAESSEKMAKLAFENPTSLEPLATALGLKTQVTELFTKISSGDGNDKGEQTAFTKHPAVIDAAFSDSVLNRKNNSEPIQVGDFKTVVLRYKKHQKAEQQTFEQVSKKIEDRLLTDRTKEKVKELAQDMQAKIRKGDSGVVLATQLNLAWTTKTDVKRSTTDVDKAIIKAVFDTPYRMPEGTSAVRLIPMPNGDYTLIVLEKVVPGDVNVEANIKKSYQQGLAEMLGRLEYSLYAMQVMNVAKIEE